MTNPSAAACPIFQGFTVEEYEQVLTLLTQESYSKGQVIIDEGKSQQDLLDHRARNLRGRQNQ